MLPHVSITVQVGSIKTMLQEIVFHVWWKIVDCAHHQVLAGVVNKVISEVEIHVSIHAQQDSILVKTTWSTINASHVQPIALTAKPETPAKDAHLLTSRWLLSLKTSQRHLFNSQPRQPVSKTHLNALPVHSTANKDKNAFYALGDVQPATAMANA